MLLNDVGDSEKKLESESDADTVVSCFKDSRPTWQEEWRGSKLSVKSRIQQRTAGRPKRSVNRKGLRLVGSCTLTAFVESEALARDTFTVKLHGPKGLGLSLFVSFEGVVTVDGLHYLPDGSPSPAQVCEIIKVGDQLVQFNDVNLEALTFYALTNFLKDLDNYGKDVVTLGFRYGSEPPPLAGSANPTEAKALICGLSTPVSTADTSFASAARRSELAMVPDPSDAFLSIFGDLDGVPITPSHGIGLNMLGNVLHTLGAWRPHKRRARGDWDSGPQTSDVELIHYIISKRHMYATAARTSTFSSLPNSAQLLGDLAEEIFEWRPFQLSALYAGFYSHLRLDGVGSSADYVPPMGPLSALITTPRDTARYQYTEHLTWDASLQGYVPMPVRTLEEWNASHALQLQTLAQIVVQLERLAQGRIARSTGRLSILHPSNGRAGNLGTAGGEQEKGVMHVLQLPDGMRCYGVGTQVNATNSRNSKGSGSGAVSQVRVTSAPYAPRTRRKVSTHALDGPAAYARLDEHIINRDHMAVKRLLGGHSEEAVQLLTTAVQEEIVSLTAATARDNPYANAKHWETNWDISLPNILLTYQLLYAAEQFQYGLLNDTSYFAALDAWATTFDPRTIITALEWQHSPHRNHYHHQQHNNNHKNGTHSGGAKHKQAQFMVYFGHDRRTARDLRVFLEVVSDLLTLLVLNRAVSSAVTRESHAMAEQAHIRDTNPRGGRLHEPDGQVVPSVFQLRYLPVQLNIADYAQSATVPAEEGDALTASYVRKFGVLLHLDALASACCLAHRAETLQALVQVAQTCPMVVEASKQLRSFVQRSQSTVVGATQLLDRVLNQHNRHPHQHQHQKHQEQHHQQPPSQDRSNTAPQLHLHGMPVLCLVLCNLRFVFEHHAALALDLSGVMFPHIRPWNVRSAIFGSDAISCTTPTPTSQPPYHLISSPKAAEPPLAQAVNTYYLYVTRLMRSHADTCSKDAALVLEWLQLALQLDAEQTDNETDGVGLSAFASPMGKRKSSYLVTARTILQHPEQYTVRGLDAAILCGAYGYTEGVIYMGQRLLFGAVRQNGADQPALNRVEAEELTRLLEEAMGKLIVEVIYQLGSSDPPDAISAALSHIGAFLCDSVRLLCTLYASLDCMNDHAPRARLAKTLDLLLEGSLEAIVSTYDEDNSETATASSSVAGRAANVVGNILQDALGVRGSLEVVRVAPYLRSRLLF